MNCKQDKKKKYSRNIQKVPVSDVTWLYLGTYVRICTFVPSALVAKHNRQHTCAHFFAFAAVNCTQGPAVLHANIYVEHDWNDMAPPRVPRKHLERVSKRNSNALIM
jgi:hypothetical protein